MNQTKEKKFEKVVEGEDILLAFGTMGLYLSILCLLFYLFTQETNLPLALAIGTFIGLSLVCLFGYRVTRKVTWREIK